MKNVSVRYDSNLKKLFIVRHRNDPRKVLERQEATNNVLNAMVQMIANYGQDGSLVSFKAEDKEYAIVMMSMQNLNEVQAYFDHKNKMIQEMQAQKMQVNVVGDDALIEQAPIIEGSEIAATEEIPAETPN